MTKKHYELIAKTIAHLRFGLGNVGDEALRERVALEFAKALANTNPQFDPDRFVSACEAKS